MTTKLYIIELSPPARTAMMACEIFKVPHEMIEVDLQNLPPDFLKKNPMHTVPVFEEGDVILHDSHAITMYLADTYGTNDDLYPKDVKERAKVNQMLLFEIGTLYRRLANITAPAWVYGEREVSQRNLDSVDEAYGFVEEFLSRTKYIATNQLTIADLSVIATLTSLNILLPLNSEKYPKTQAYIKEMEKYDFYQKHNVPGLLAYEKVLRQMLDF